MSTHGLGALKSLKEAGASILMVEQNFAMAKRAGRLRRRHGEMAGSIWTGTMDELATDKALQEKLMGLSMESRLMSQAPDHAPTMQRLNLVQRITGPSCPPFWCR